MFKNKKGFTLVELVVVIAILGILAGLAIPYFLDSQAQARSAKAAADMRILQGAVEGYLAAGNTVALIGNPKTDGANLFQNMKEKGFIAAIPEPPKGYYYIAVTKTRYNYSNSSYGVESDTNTSDGEHRQIMLAFVTDSSGKTYMPYDMFINNMILGVLDV
ncbi:type II secretion system protein [uncultured Phascolarctobacterium sp.]|uniref:type IV pilin protein n=1 Tax=uncultured Phascolarctobacterium sp. TaxID=512296 RepID=UPI0015AA21A0|nr:type II secretion system protein [uncultured Phascolarctobacterium sp.]